jgi:putative transposase
MSRKRKKHTEAMKARVALEAIKGVRTLSELSAAYGVHSTVIAQWKRQLVQGEPDVFCRGKTARTEEELTAPLYEEIGRLKMEIDWLKKSFERRPGETPSMDRARTRAIVDCAPMHAGCREPVELLLPAAGHGERREPSIDAGHRPVVFEAAVLRSAA